MTRKIDEDFAKHCKTVWVDLDATLAEYSHWAGIYEIGPPIAGALTFMMQLQDACVRHGLRIGILTVRTNPNYPGREEVLNRNQWARSEDEMVDCLRNIVEQWLHKYAFPFAEVYTGRGKPNGVAYIDDKGVACDPQIEGRFSYTAALGSIERFLRK